MTARRPACHPIALGLATLALLAHQPAGAIDTLLPGKLHIIKDGKLTKLVAPGSYTVPASNGPGDPTIGGGTLTVVDTDDTLGLGATLPAAGWTGLGNPAGSKGWKYKGAGSVGDPCKIVLVKSTIIKFVCRDDQALDPPLDGASAIVLALNNDRFCAEFGGTTVKNVPGLLKRKDAAAPGACWSPPPTSTSTTTPISSTTTTSGGPSCCNAAGFHGFVTTSAVGTCGNVRDSSGGTTISLACGDLYFGGGGASGSVATVPNLVSFVTELTNCTGQSATLGPTTSADTGLDTNCTAAGCLFGAPLSVPNPTTTPVSTCVLNVVATDAVGTLDCNTGTQTLAVPLASNVYLTGDTATDPTSTLPGIQPCPLCSAGTCVGGPNDGLACTPGTTALNPGYPTSHDCPPDPMFDIGTLPIAFSLSSGTVAWTGTPATNDTGSTSSVQSRVFSGYCRDADATSAFQNPAQRCWENGLAIGSACAQPEESCEQRTNGAFGPGGNANMTITEIGSPQTGILAAPAPGRLVSIFSIPPTFDATVDTVGDLPGPGAVSLPGTGSLCGDAMTCP